jgi:predicted RNA binding protein YcfA (HicA-like mRNA interferase family)
MSKSSRLLQRFSDGNFKNVKFGELKQLLKTYGFLLERTSGSHHIFTHPQIREIVNIQNVKGEAKPYQTRQVLQVIERYNLRGE